MKKLNLILIVAMMLGGLFAKAQVPTCSPDVPYFFVDLTGQPAGTWTSPGHSRVGNCCGTTAPDNCTSFDVKLDPQAAMVSFNIASGAVPPGALYYQINCGPQIPVGQPICISGVGPHHVTFCKPGNNQNTYVLTSIPKPIFPPDATVRLGCSKKLNTLGMEVNSVTWTSIYPGTQGQYNSYLSCTSSCPSPTYTPVAGAPAYIDYKVCGYPIADECGFVALCDTVRVYNVGALTASVSPNPAQFCSGGGGVLLTASAGGGDGVYSYIWKDQNGTTVGTGTTYQATGAGIYTLEARDGLYDPTMCPPVLVSVPVVVGLPPVVNAGPDQTVCASSPTAYLAATIQNAPSGIWSGGNGTFSPNNTSLTASYTPSVAELTAGSVTLTLTSVGAGGGCVNTPDQIVIHYPSLLSVSLASQSLSCNNSTVTLSPVVSGGTTPYGYFWNNGSVSSSITVGAGNYCVNILDAIGCPASVCANVTVPTALSLTMSSTDATTNGGSDGTATASVSGGMAPYTYLWSPGGQVTQTATGLSYGVYTVLVTDAKGCTISSSTVVNEPRCNGFQVSILATDILCHGDIQGSAIVNATGGTAPYTYLWNSSPSQTTSNLTNVSAGTYIVTVTESNGCIDVSSVVISQPTQLANTINHTNISVVGVTEGTAPANPSGGNSPHTYLWANGATTATISNLSAGTYSVTITDNNGCSIIDKATIVEPPCNNIALNVYSTNVSCAGGSNGSITAQLFFGTAPYSYVWNNGSTSATISGLTAGTYSVVATDAKNCSDSRTITITEPTNLSLGLAPTSISCSTQNDGTIDLTVSGGTYPYSFNWSNGINVEDLYLLSNGNYTVTVTDAKGCVASQSTSIARPSEVNATGIKTDVTCNGGTDGSVNVSVSGGTLPYTYLWSNGATTKNISGLSKGQYFLTITDANGCHTASILSFLVDEPEMVSASSITKICPVPSSGVSQILLTPAGGNGGPYQVSVDGGLTYLTSGNYNFYLPIDSTYNVYVKDGNGCKSILNKLKLNSAVAVSSISFAKCFASGTSTTAVTVVPSGGTGGSYQVSFNNGVSFGPVGNYTSNLPIANSYSIVVKDSAGCVSTASSIVIPDTLALSQVSSVYAGGYNISCNGLSNGNINLSVLGGVSAYTYLWSNASTAEDIFGVPAGNYSVIVTDRNGCTKSLVVTLSQPNVLVASPVVSTNYNGYGVSCNGSTDGAIDLTVSGGVASYNYTWSNTSTTEDLSSVGVGTYVVQVTDANNCNASNSVSVSEPTALALSTSVVAASCNGFSNGSIDLTTAGGVSTYAYNWSNSATTEDISGLLAGNYSVNVTDLNGCTLSTSATITEPFVLTATTSTTDVSCNGGNDGTATLTATGGTLLYTYLWSNSQTTALATGLLAGDYSVVVTDKNACTFSTTVSISEPTALAASASATDVSCFGGSNGTATASINGGTLPYTYLWSDGQTNAVAVNLIIGTYSVTATDAKGCVISTFATVGQPTLLTSTISNTNVSCNGGNNGTATITVSGGILSYNYLWSNSETNSTIGSLSAGNYSVVVTDGNGCTLSNEVAVGEPLALNITTSSVGASCNGGVNGSASVSVTGGTLPYTYQWSNGQTVSTATNLSLGTYTTTVTDNHSCTQVASVSVTEQSPIVLSFNQINPLCFGDTDGYILLDATGGVSPYTYQWSNGSTTEDLSKIGQGTYIVTVHDNNLCEKIDTVIVTQPDSLYATVSSNLYATGYNVSTNGGTDGSIALNVIGGVNPYLYQWSNGTTEQNLENLNAGIYSVMITDYNGCNYKTSIELTQPFELAMPTGISPNGDGKNDYFLVHGLDVYPDNEIQIFNRWGDEVYAKDGYLNQWNGQNKNGGSLPDGTYFVVLKVNVAGTEKVLKGYVDVRR